jgi:hypothetical protein
MPDTDIYLACRDLNESESGERNDLEIAIAMSSSRYQGSLAKGNHIDHARCRFASRERDPAHDGRVDYMLGSGLGSCEPPAGRGVVSKETAQFAGKPHRNASCLLGLLLVLVRGESATSDLDRSGDVFEPPQDAS